MDRSRQTITFWSSVIRSEACVRSNFVKTLTNLTDLESDDGGTVVIALMVLAAFSNMAVAGGCARSGEGNTLSSEQVEQKQNSDADV